jgi:putative lipoic acid-binding regulatory protein
MAKHKPTASSPRPTGLTFPCNFPIKAMGHNRADFEALVVSIVQKHAADLTEKDIRRRVSGGGNYLSVTVTITARSQAQLDAIYLELNTHEWVMMVL